MQFSDGRRNMITRIAPETPETGRYKIPMAMQKTNNV